MRRTPQLAALAATIMAAGACQVAPPAAEVPGVPAPPTGDFVTVPRPLQPWTPAGLEEQPRMDVLRAVSPPEFSPATTAWRAAARPIPPGFRAGDARAARNWTQPGLVVADLARELGLPATLGTDAWELTSRVLAVDANNATGILLQWGLLDDAVAGSDLRIGLRRDAQGWYVERLDERLHCRRGVTAEGLCI
jgi:hypothetical protein